MSGNSYHMFQARKSFQEKKFVQANNSAIAAIESFPPTAEEFSELWWIIFQCQLEEKLRRQELRSAAGNNLLLPDNGLRPICNVSSKMIFLERRRESSMILVNNINDLIMAGEFARATACIAHAETLISNYNRHNDRVEGSQYWSTSQICMDLERLKGYQQILEKLINDSNEQLKASEAMLDQANAKIHRLELEVIRLTMQQTRVSQQPDPSSSAPKLQKPRMEQSHLAQLAQQYSWKLTGKSPSEASSSSFESSETLSVPGDQFGF